MSDLQWPSRYTPTRGVLQKAFSLGLGAMTCLGHDNCDENILDVHRIGGSSTPSRIEYRMPGFLQRAGDTPAQGVSHHTI